jgi:ABC-2 type transport system ATP-binding protein
MGQKNQLWWDLPAMESFILNKEIYEVPEEKYKKTLNELTDMLEVSDILKIQVRKLSLGQRMKCELIAALLHSPKVLFLDEPTIGLDVIAQKNMRDFIKEYNRKYNATIILTSHYMTDVKELCKRVIIINEGKIVYDGYLEKIVNKFAPYKVISVDFSKEVSREDLEKFGEVLEYDMTHVKIRINKKDIAKMAEQILSRLHVDDLTIEDPPIEEIIRDIFSETKKF